MFGFFKSSDALEKELRDWSIQDEIRVRGDTEVERQEIREYIRTKELRNLVEDIATDLLNNEMQAHRQFFGTASPAGEEAHRKRGRKLLNALLNAKNWRVDRDGEGYYKLKPPAK